MTDSRRTVRLLDTGAGEPAFNMALDEVLLHAGEPVVRFYGWQPPGLSLGYFQRAQDLDLRRPRELGFTVVRRTTGGGAIAHVEEFTFSVCAAEGGRFFDADVRGGCLRLHETLARAIATLGGECRRRGSSAAVSDAPAGSWLCFYHSTELDLVARERKLLGSAQRRSAGRLLHHGSLPIGRNPLTPEAMCLEELLGREVSFPEVATAVRAELEREYLVRLVDAEPTAAEHGAAARLVEEKYGSRAWTERR